MTHTATHDNPPINQPIATRMESASKTRFGLLMSSVEADLERRIQSSKVTLRTVMETNLSPVTIAGVSHAVNVFYSAVDNKLAEFMRLTGEAEQQWMALHAAKGAAKKSHAEAPQPEPHGAFSGRKRREWNEQVAREHAAMGEALETLLGSVDAYAHTQTLIAQLRFEITQLINGAAMFVSEQVAMAKTLAQQAQQIEQVRAPAAQPASGLSLVSGSPEPRRSVTDFTESPVIGDLTRQVVRAQ